jgi:hypothetical protein
MRIFLGRAWKFVAAMTSIVALLFVAAVAVNSIGRIEKLESEIKSLRLDLENPRVRGASTLDAGGTLVISTGRTRTLA